MFYRGFQTLENSFLVFGNPGKTLALVFEILLNSYLTNRYQVVRIHSTVSDPIPIEYGVPQGSILGPLLSSIYLTIYHKLHGIAILNAM